MLKNSAQALIFFVYIAMLNKFLCSAYRSTTVTRASLFSTRLLSSKSGNTVKSLTVKDFNKILSGDSRSLYQIIDVREPNELETVALKGSDVINLPLGAAGDWSPKVQTGELLNPDKPTLCMVIFQSIY